LSIDNESDGLNGVGLQGLNGVGLQQYGGVAKVIDI